MVFISRCPLGKILLDTTFAWSDFPSFLYLIFSLISRVKPVIEHLNG